MSINTGFPKADVSHLNYCFLYYHYAYWRSTVSIYVSIFLIMVFNVWISVFRKHSWGICPLACSECVENSDYRRRLVQELSVSSYTFLYLPTGSHIVIHAGDVYFAINVVTGEEIAVKMERLDADYPKLAHEWEVYKSIGAGPGIPQVLWCGAERGYRAMCMNLLGPSLEDLFNRCNRKFTLKMVLMSADQLVSSVWVTKLCPILIHLTVRYPGLNTFILVIIFTATLNPKTSSLA